MTLPADTVERLCANCGASAPGAFCPSCGQNTRERLPTFLQFMREATGRYIRFDGKFWKTLFALLFRPGFLTREYFAGRRERYVGPARLFLVSSVLLFAALRLASEAIDLDTAIISDSTDEPASKSESKSPGRKIFRNRLPGEEDDIRLDLGSLPETMEPLKKRLDRFNHLPRTQKVEQVVGNTLRYGPYAMFVLLPAFAALLKLVYLGRRRRHPARPRLYAEHLVFAAHNHAFLFLVLTLLFAIPVEGVRQLMGVWILVYLAWSMHSIYRGSWVGIVARAFVIFFTYVVLFAVVTAGLLIAAILLR